MVGETQKHWRIARAPPAHPEENISLPKEFHRVPGCGRGNPHSKAIKAGHPDRKVETGSPGYMHRIYQLT